MSDDEHQRALRELLDELQAICHARGIGGSLLLVSEEAAAWRQVVPAWVALRSMPKGFVLELRGSTPAGHARTVNTLHFIGSLRDMAGDCVNLWGRLFRQARGAIEAGGGELLHQPFGGAAHRPDPHGGKGS